jgi:hypothetical protein
VETQTRLVVPLFDFLLEALDEQQVTLGCLIRYAQRCEWFDRANLAEKVAERKDSDADYKQVEKLLQFDLYRYLHDQGVNFVIEPYSVRGEIDLIVDQRGGDRHFIETKVFDNRDKGKKYLRSGFHQLATYLGQYRAPVGYLAIYKLCQESLEFEADGQAGNVLFVTHEGRTIYLLVIDLYQHDKSVSQRGPLKVVRITRDELAKPVDSASPSPDEVVS